MGTGNEFLSRLLSRVWFYSKSERKSVTIQEITTNLASNPWLKYINEYEDLLEEGSKERYDLTPTDYKKLSLIIHMS